jgi:hypothetical protein
MKERIADFLISMGFWIDGKGWYHDEFNAGFKAGCNAMRDRMQYEAIVETRKKRNGG